MIDYKSFTTHLERIKRLSPKGSEFWWGRELAPVLGYRAWENFDGTVRRAVTACERSGQPPLHHFHATKKMVEIGSGARRERAEWGLSRYACYLVAMNGDSSKLEIAHAQTYFALQTRRQELSAELEDAEQRLKLREEMRLANKDLSAAAAECGVEEFPAFQAAGYQGLYGGRTMRQIKEAKKVSPKEQMLDRMGSTELAANSFRATQTKDKLRRDSIQGDAEAKKTHHDVGKKVRETIQSLGGTPPEDLPSEPPIKEIKSKVKRLRGLKGEEAP